MQGSVLIDALADGGVASGLTKDMSVTLAAQAVLVSGLRAWAVLSDHPNWAVCNVLFVCGWMIRCVACVLSAGCSKDDPGHRPTSWSSELRASDTYTRMFTHVYTHVHTHSRTHAQSHECIMKKYICNLATRDDAPLL